MPAHIHIQNENIIKLPAADLIEFKNWRARRDEARILMLILSARERQVSRLVAEGQSNNQIGEQLGISPKTVEKHRSNAMKKLNVTGTPGLVRLISDAL